MGILNVRLGLPGGSEVKVSASNEGDPGSISGLGRSPGEGNDNPLQYSCLNTTGYSPRGRKESDTTERFHSLKRSPNLQV